MTMNYVVLGQVFTFKGISFVQAIVYGIALIVVIALYYYHRWRKRVEEELLQKSREDYLKAHPDLSEECKDAIIKGNLILEMSEEEIRASIGSPRKVKILTVKPAGSEVRIFSNGLYLHIYEGHLKNWEKRKRLVSL